jgi:acetyl esterase
MLGAAPQVAPGSRAANAPLLNAADCIAFAQFYAGTASPSPAADPEYAPLAAAVFGHLAPAAIFASGFDPLRQDAADYAAALHAAGVPVAYREDPGLVHGWLRARHRASLADRAFTALLQAVSDLAAGRLRPA